MIFNQNQFNELLKEHSFKYMDLVEACCNRADIDSLEDNNDLYDLVLNAVNDEMIYCNDQWTLLQEFFNPDDLTSDSLNEAFNNLIEDVYSCFE